MTLSKEVVMEKIKKANVVVLNVLPEEEFRELHIPGSQNLPLGQDQGSFAQAAEMKYGREKFFIVYGSSLPSLDAMNAAVALRKRGLWAEVYLGGMKEWSEAGLPAEGTNSQKKAVLK